MATSCNKEELGASYCDPASGRNHTVQSVQCVVCCVKSASCSVPNRSVVCSVQCTVGSSVKYVVCTVRFVVC